MPGLANAISHSVAERTLPIMGALCLLVFLGRMGRRKPSRRNSPAAPRPRRPHFRRPILLLRLLQSSRLRLFFGFAAGWAVGRLVSGWWVYWCWVFSPTCRPRWRSIGRPSPRSVDFDGEGRWAFRRDVAEFDRISAGGPLRMVRRLIWSGRERSSHSRLGAVPK